MFDPSPRVVTIEIAHEDAGREPALCAAEILSVVNGLADIHVGCLRFVATASDHDRKLLRAVRLAAQRDLPATVSMAVADEALLRELALVRPTAIAVPLHGATAGVHTLAAPALGWSDSIALAVAARIERATLEVETRVTPSCLGQLERLATLIESLDAQRWALDFSGIDLQHDARATEELLLDLAGRDRLFLTVYDLPRLRQRILERLRRRAAVPDLRRFTLIDTAQCLRIANDGEIFTEGPRCESIGHVRRQPVVLALQSRTSRNGSSEEDVLHSRALTLEGSSLCPAG